MGLLDDAIREHLELKRRRGADPGEVAREQREVLDSPAEADGAPADNDAGAGAPEDADLALDAPVVDPDSPSPPSDPPGGSALAGETAELDMSSVLGEEESTARGAAAAEIVGRERADPGVSSGTSGEADSLEWEVPGEAVEGEADEPAEDVLEETPDFLRDTPEQERLWFEQRPPRDFDFDK
jgi:hypothetical protein